LYTSNTSSIFQTNSAFSFGGPKLLVETLEQDTGLRIDAYLEIGFGGFVNVIDASKFQGVDDGKCDATTNYPITGPNTTPDTYPDCFNGSVRTNIHYHGTHTNPNTTGDNVFLEIWPSPRNT